MIDKPLTFVDIETTGTNAVSGRIIEIGIIKVQEDQVVAEYQKLINPEMRIDPFIEQMTGIRFDDLENAPTFYSIKDEIYEILEGAIFVAHNVRFDYSFIRNEFKRCEINFSTKHFDTVKLARILYPGHARYNLDAISERHGITNEGRHRAFGDAKVLWDFYMQSKKNLEEGIFQEALKLVLRKPTLPPSISKEDVEKLPETPGVYIFLGDENTPLYIGKSINIKDRVLSHFANDYMSETDMKIAQTVKAIEVIETAGDLSALLMESALIKKMKPVYNRVLRSSGQKPVAVKTLNENGYYTVAVKNMEEVEKDEIENVLGVYKSKRQLKESLYEVTKENGLCTKLMGLDKGKGRCFNYQLGMCSGACMGEEPAMKYNLRFDDAFYQKKVKPWKFGRPVVIKEIGQKSEIHVVDSWCYMGSVTDETADITDIKLEYKFDYDVYKILKRYIKNPNNSKNISFLKATEEVSDNIEYL
jgi:DNA polymerase-3 subunit epsilon